MATDFIHVDRWDYLSLVGYPYLLLAGSLREEGSVYVEGYLFSVQGVYPLSLYFQERVYEASVFAFEEASEDEEKIKFIVEHMKRWAEGSIHQAWTRIKNNHRAKSWEKLTLLESEKAKIELFRLWIQNLAGSILTKIQKYTQISDLKQYLGSIFAVEPVIHQNDNDPYGKGQIRKR